MKTEVYSVRMTPDLLDEIRNAADEDFRKTTDEVLYLINLGMKTRQTMKSVKAGSSQIDMGAFNEA